MLQLSSRTSRHILSKPFLVVLACILLISSVTGIMAFKHAEERAYAASCGDVFDPIPSWLTTRLNENKSVYQQVATETGVPWQVLAAVHYREFNMAVSNPANGQGIYQLYSSGQYFPPGAVDRNGFIHQTRLAANFIQGKAQYVPATSTIKARKLTTNDTDTNLIKSTLFSYNGRASAYAQQAATYGYSSSSQPYEGSPYVMNKFDCERRSMGLITSDGGNSLTGTDTRMGAFTLYARLKGDAYWNGLQIGNVPVGCTAATNTTNACVWRLYNRSYKSYILTTSYNERNSYIAQGYRYDGVSFYGRSTAAKPITRQIPIYRLQNGNNNTFLTRDTNEYNALKAAGWEDEGIAFYADPVGSNTGYPVYRLYNSSTGNHLWTADTTERANLIKAGNIDEGIAYHAISSLRQETPPISGQKVVYRFSGMPNNGHFWTTDLRERDSMIRAGYKYERVAWNASAGSTTKPVYRLYSTTLKAHLYTTDTNERSILKKSSDWKDEGIAWYSNPAISGSPVYRLYNKSNTRHLFTTDANERKVLIRSGIFVDEGIAWRQP